MKWAELLCKEGSPLKRVKKTEEERRVAHCRRQAAYKARGNLVGGLSSARRLPEAPPSFIWMPLPTQPWAFSSSSAACASVAALPAVATFATSAASVSSPACASSAVSAFSAACASSVAFASAATFASVAACASSAAFDGDVAAVAPSHVADFTSAAVPVAVAAVGEDDNDGSCPICQHVAGGEGEAVAQLACGHLFCLSCIDSLTRHSRKHPVDPEITFRVTRFGGVAAGPLRVCPVCRRSVLEACHVAGRPTDTEEEQQRLAVEEGRVADYRTYVYNDPALVCVR